MTTKGFKEVRQQLGRFGNALRIAVENEAAISAETVRSRVVVDINTQKENPNYTVPAGATGRRRHIPSPPGGPPNSDTGRLAASYTTTTSKGSFRVRASVVAGVVYAFWLEYGTRKMLPRPHLLPRFNEEAPQFNRRVRELANAEIRRANKTGRS